MGTLLLPHTLPDPRAAPLILCIFMALTPHELGVDAMCTSVEDEVLCTDLSLRTRHRGEQIFGIEELLGGVFWEGGVPNIGIQLCG